MKLLDVFKRLLPFSGRSAELPEEQVNEQCHVEQTEPECHDTWADTVESIQLGFTEFTTEKGVIGFYLDPDNRWLQLAKEVFPPEIEVLYQKRLLQMRDTTKGIRLATKLQNLKQDDAVNEYGAQLVLPNIDLAVFQAAKDETPVEGEATKAGRTPFSSRLVLGILIAQAILNLSDRGICKLVSESPYLQKFLGYTSFSVYNTVDASNLVHFRKRLDVETMKAINEIVQNKRVLSKEYEAAAHADKTDVHTAKNDEANQTQSDESDLQEPVSDEKPMNTGTLILDATCGPVNIRFPQDFSILNEGRLDLENVINRLCREYGFSKPRTYVRVIQKEATNLSKSKKKTEEAIRHVVRLELNAIKRNLEYIDSFLACDPKEENKSMLYPEEVEKMQIIRAVYAQQKYMYELKTHRVTNRIVSIALPFVRPISRGKVNTPTEFGPKYDIAVDENGFTWITCFSFDNFSESTHLQGAVESYKTKTGHYPARVLVDQIYRNTDNRKYCKEHGIRISGPALGRKPKVEALLEELINTEKQDMVERISVERHFSREKRCFGIEEIVEKTEETIGHAIGMAVFLDNVVPVGF